MRSSFPSAPSSAKIMSCHSVPYSGQRGICNGSSLFYIIPAPLEKYITFVVNSQRARAIERLNDIVWLLCHEGMNR